MSQATFSPESTGPLSVHRTKSNDDKERVSQSYWAAEQNDVETDVSLPNRLHLVREFGDFSLAYSLAVQPVLKHFGDDNGFIAYRQRWGVTIALGDPVASRDHAPQLIRDFIDHFKRPAFCQTSRRTAAWLHDEGYYCNQMGIDTTIDLPNYDFSGKSKEWLRYASNWIKRRDYTIAECSFSDLDTNKVEELSEAWRKTRTVKRKEVRFLNRPIVLDDEQDVRKFFLFDQHGNISAFIFLDPIYLDGEITGYVTAFKRRHPDAPQYSEHALMKGIIEQLQSEGVYSLKLGLSPGANIENDEFRSNWLTRKCMEMGYRSRIINRYFYHVQGHANYKRRFRGNEEKAYFSSPGRFDAYRLGVLIGLCGIA